MKKVIATLSIILILLNICAPMSKADVSRDTMQSLLAGEASLPGKDGGESTQINTSIDASGNNNKSSIITGLLQILSMLPRIVNMIISGITLQGNTNYIQNNHKYSIFTIQEMLLGKYYLFDIDFFNTSNHSDPNSNTINNIKENVAIWYVTIRNISLVGSALIIIYVGIRLALAVTSSEGGPRAAAKYKKMLTSWIVGFILIFILQYLVKGIFYLSDIFTNFIFNAVEKGSINSDMEKVIIVDSMNGIAGARGINKLSYVVLYFAIVYYQLKFFLIYIKRSFETFFLMIISPLVCMLYPIDSIGDGRSQSFKAWFQKLIANILLRPIHLFVYVIFIFTASELAKTEPIVAIAFFAALSNGEKIIKTILGLSGQNIKDQKLPKFKMPRRKGR